MTPREQAQEGLTELHLLMIQPYEHQNSFRWADQVVEIELGPRQPDGNFAATEPKLCFVGTPDWGLLRVQPMLLGYTEYSEDDDCGDCYWWVPMYQGTQVENAVNPASFLSLTEVRVVAFMDIPKQLHAQLHPYCCPDFCWCDRART